MKTVSAGYKSAQSSSLIYPVRKIELLRMLPDGSGWEANATDVSAEVTKLDRLSWKLDTDALNEFKVSNLSVAVDNSDRRWDDGSPSRFQGYLRSNSKIRISLGLTVAQAPDIFPVFTGVIADAIERTPEPILQLNLQSLDTILGNAISDNAAILVSNELVGTGDGVAQDFLLSQYPVGKVLDVRVNGVSVAPTLWWTVKDLNKPGSKATLSFPNIQPGPGAAINVDYIVWQVNQDVDAIVRGLINSVPLIQASRIDPVNFSPAAQVERMQFSIGDFSAYSLANLLVQPKPLPPGASALPNPPPLSAEGRITLNPFNTTARWLSNPVYSNIDFDQIQNAIQPLWSSQYEADIDINAENILANEFGPRFRWIEDYNSATVTMAGSVRAITQNGGGNNYFLFNSYETPTLFGTPYSARCVCARLSIPTLGGGVVVLGGAFGATGVGAQIEFPDTGHVRARSAAVSANYALDVTQFHAYRLAMIPSNPVFGQPPTGTWILYVDGVQVLTGTLGTLSSAPNQYGPLSPLGSGINLVSSAGNLVLNIDFLRFYSLDSNPPSGSMTFKTAYGDALAALVSFSLISTLGPFYAGFQGQASDLQFFVSWSQDDLTYSTEVAVPLGGNIGNWVNTNSPLFVKFRLVMTDHLNSTEIAVTNLLLPGLAVSPGMDGGAGVVSWDSWQASVTPNNGSVLRFTEAGANSLSGYSFADPIGPDPGDAIQSGNYSVAQGFGMPTKMRFIALMSASGPTPPVLNWNDIKFTTSSIVIAMANFAERSVRDVLDELAQLADYEIGMDSNGSFFFRDKAPASVSLLTLDGSNVLSVSSFSTGWDRIYNYIKATFGSGEKDVYSQTEGEPVPTSVQRFGARILAVGSSQLLYDTDTDYATALAKRYFYRYKEPKRQAILTVRFMPELELSDRVSVNIAIPRQVGTAFDAKVTGIAHDLMNFTTELDLLEV